MKGQLYLRPIFKEDWPQVSKIYQDGIETKMATFETKVPKWKKWKNDHILNCSLVAQLGQEILGFATISKVSERYVYRGVGEVSLYIDKRHFGKGIGETLLKALISLSEENGYWTLQASIFVNNNASIKLHEKCGFRVVGIRKKIGQRDGSWQDNILMERRSNLIGNQ